MIANPKEFYESEAGYRESWLLDAERSASVTIPNLRVRGFGMTGSPLGFRSRHAKGDKGNTKPFSNVGRDGLNTLSNTLLTLLYPLDIREFRLETDDATKQALIAEGVFEDEADIEEALRELEDKIISRQADMSLRSKLHALFRRNLVEGTNVLHLWKDEKGRSGLRIIPLRNIVIKRQNGELQKLVIKDQITTSDGEERALYTEIDYDEGKVYQLEDGGKRKTPQEIDDRTSFYIVITPSMPEVEDYADGYVYELLGDLELHNDLTHSTSRAIAISAKQIMVNDMESGISSYDLQEVEPGEILTGTVRGGVAEGIGWVSSSVVNNNIAPVISWMERIEDRLTRQFAGLLSAMTDQFAQPRSATEIARIASELDTFAAGIGQVFNATLQRPLAQAFLDLVLQEEAEAERERLIEEAAAAGATEEQINEIRRQPIVTDAIKISPRIVAGNSQLSRLQELSKYLQAISTQLAQFPEFRAEFDQREIWERMTNALGIDTEGTLKSEEQKQAELRAQQDALAQQQLQQAQGQGLDQIREQQLASLRQTQIAENTTGI